MLSAETFKRMRNLTKRMEQFEDEGLYSSKKGKELVEVTDNCEMIKVNEPGTNNYHFELRQKYAPHNQA
jgi:hypothetical protein